MASTPPSQLTASQKKSLRALFPGDALLLDPEATAVYGTDAGRKPGLPWAVARPSSVEEVAALLKWADAEKVPILPRSRGTNVVGSATADKGGVVLSLLRLNRVLDISADDFCAVTEPGVVTAELQRQVEAKGLFYPPDPASVKISTIGGNVATNAGGLRAVKYGVTKDYVLGLKAVLPGGRCITMGGRTHKNVVGLDLTRLFVGSEGTLGVVTEVTLKLLPKPEATGSVLAGFPSLEDCLQGARNVFRAGFLPTVMEFMDSYCLKAAADSMDVPWPKDTAAALLFRLDGSREALAHDLQGLKSALAAANVASVQVGQSPEEEEALWEIRRALSTLVYVFGPQKLSDDIAVPRGKVREAVRAFHALGERLGLTVLCFGHLGDGNIHVDVMYDESRGEKERAEEAKREQLKIALSFGGTLSGEHGVGLSKLPYIGWQIGPEELALMRGIKRVFDPNNIMNPGKAY